MQKMMSLVLMVALVCITVLAQAAPCCFSEQADYSYSDEKLTVQIRFEQGSDLAYFVCDVQASEPDGLKAALSHDRVNGELECASDIAKRNNAVLAINGDDYSVHKYGVILRNGQLIRVKNTTRHMLYLGTNGDLHVVSDRSDTGPKDLAAWLLEEGISQAWEFGPELVRDGKTVTLDSRFDLICIKNSTKEPRTAIGQIDTGHYIVIVVDGRRKGYSQGISLQGLQQLFLEYGAKTAFNLDGGGSATLVFQGEVINKPSGGKQRPVADILYF